MKSRYSAVIADEEKNMRRAQSKFRLGRCSYLTSRAVAVIPVAKKHCTLFQKWARKSGPSPHSSLNVDHSTAAEAD